MKLQVDSRGSGAGLVLLHGWGMHGGVWGSVRNELARNFRVHAVDLPGYAGSPPCQPYTLVQIAELLAAAFPEPVHVCGWSLGAQVAMQWALAQPAQVRQLMLVSATPRFVAGRDWPCGMAEDVFRQFAQQVAEDYRGTLTRFLSLQVQGGDLPREQVRRLRLQFFLRPVPAPEALRAGLNILLATDLRERVAEIRQPTLLVHGTHDMLAPAAAAAWLAAHLPDARLLMLDKAAHAPFLSHAADFVRAATGFLHGD